MDRPAPSLEDGLLGPGSSLPPMPGYGFDSAPSLSAILDEYRINSKSFQREMESFVGAPSPDKDGLWQHTAIKFLNSPVQSPRGTGPASHGPASNGPASNGTAHAHNSGFAVPRPVSNFCIQDQAQRQQQQQQQQVSSILPVPETYSASALMHPAPPALMLPRPHTAPASRPFHSVATWHGSDTTTNSVNHISEVSNEAVAEIWAATSDNACRDSAGRSSATNADPIRALTNQMSISSLQEQQRGMEAAAAAAAAIAAASTGPAPHTSPQRQTHFVTTGMLSDAWNQPTRTSSTAVNAMNVPPTYAAGPASAPILQFQKRQRSVRSQLTFEAYENQYGPSAKCESGPCADHCSTPCKQHTCKCCKKHRRLEGAGSARSKGYCGKCSRREKVDGLEFVKCGHVQIIDGVTIQCGVEMLREVFDNHWKQHKNDSLPVSLEVDTDEGRKCGACTNMRPVSFYPNQDTNCSCSHCQVVKAKAATKGAGGVLPAGTSSVDIRRVSTPTGHLSTSSGYTMGASMSDQIRRHSYTSGAPGTPTTAMSYLHLNSNNVNDTSSTMVSGNPGMSGPDQSSPASMHNLGQWSNPYLIGTADSGVLLTGMTSGSTRFPSVGQSQVATGPGTMSHLLVDGGLGSGSNALLGEAGLVSGLQASGAGGSPHPVDEQTLQQAHAVLSSALSSVLAARPTLEVVMGQVGEVRSLVASGNPSAGGAIAATALNRVIQASHDVEREVTKLMQEVNALLSGQS